MNGEINQEKNKPETTVEAKTGLSLGVKILLTAVVIGSVAAGVYLAFALAR